MLYPIIWRLVITSKTGKIYHRDLWAEITSEFVGVYDKEHKPNEYQSEDFGTIYRQTVGTVLEHTFGGKRNHTMKGNTFTFDPPRLKRVAKSYNIKSKIQTRLVTSNNNNEHMNTLNTIEEVNTPKNSEKNTVLGNSKPKSRGNSTSNNTKKRGDPSGSCSEGQEQEPNLDLLAEELRDIYDGDDK